MKARSLVAPFVALSLLGLSCANSSAVGGGGGSGGDAIEHPTAPADLVLRISSEGGFVAPDFHLTQVPAFSLFGDGTAVAPGAQTAIYPGPALPPVTTSSLTEEGVQALLRAALDAGLGSDASYTDLGSVGIADATTTVFTLTVNGATHVTKVYALGELGPKPAGMGQGEFDTRSALLRFQGTVQDLPASLPKGSVGDAAPFVPDELRLLVSDYRPDAQLTEPAVTWPLGAPLATFGDASTMAAGSRCGSVSGADLAAVLPLAQRANQLTPWRSEGSRYAIAFRPLLPDESGC